MQPDLELKPTSGGRVALILGAVTMLLIAALLSRANGLHGGARIGWMLAFVAGAAALVVLAIRITRRRVRLDREGIEVRGVFGARRLAWSDVGSYSFVSIDNQGATYAQGGLVAVLVVAAVKALRKKPQNRSFKSGRLVLHGNDGTKLAIHPWFVDIDQGLERIFAELHPRLAATAGTDFGKLAFDGRTLSHPTKGSLALHEIDKVVVTSGGVVAVRKVGKRLGWASIRMSTISSSLLLFERLAQAGVIVQMSESVFLPLPTLGLLSQLATARQNLPQARIAQR